MKITVHTVLNFLNFTSSLLMLFFVQPLSRNCYKLSSVVTFTFIQTFDQNFVFTERCHADRQCEVQLSKVALFSVSNLKDEKLI